MKINQSTPNNVFIFLRQSTYSIISSLYNFFNISISVLPILLHKLAPISKSPFFPATYLPIVSILIAISFPATPNSTLFLSISKLTILPKNLPPYFPFIKHIGVFFYNFPSNTLTPIIIGS